MTRVFLFDIDGTLVSRAGPQHGRALVEAIRRVLTVETSMDGIPVHGMLDPDILAEMLSRAGVGPTQIGASMNRIVELAQEIYPPTCPDLRDKVLPGVCELLSELAERGYPTGLVTGNLTRMGWTKVERAGLREYFQFGAFAGMGKTRADLARLARELSGAGADARITLIGDAPSDVEAAQRNGFRSVAVATGMTAADELRALKPDLLLNDLRERGNRKLLIHG